MGHSAIVEKEKLFWEQHQAFEWLSLEGIGAVIDHLPPLTGDVLELCAGSGMFTRHIPAEYDAYVALDLSETLLARLEKTVPGVHAVLGDAMEPDFPDQSFDCITVFAGLHHLPDLERTIRSAGRLLRPGGRFFCFEPNDLAWYRAPMKLMKPLIGIYSDDEVFIDPRRLHRHLDQAGFGDIREAYLSPRYSDDFLAGAMNRFLARLIYLSASLSASPRWQAFFVTSAQKT